MQGGPMLGIPQAVVLLLLAAIGLVCLGGLAGPAMTAERAGDCVGPGCEGGIACARNSATGPPTPARPSTVLGVLAAAGAGIRAPAPTGVADAAPPTPGLGGPSVSRGGSRSPPTV